MLTHLLVRNLAVVDEVEVELGAGLTALTGETGAGKSILVDALGLALGERADSDAVRTGAARAEITASFELTPDSKAARWLVDNDLNADEADAYTGCVVRRAVTSEGRSRGYINGNPAPMQTLRALGDMLVDICGQQAHQSLTRPDKQRELLDHHGDYGWLLDDVRAAHAQWQALATRLKALEADKADQAARLDLLRFQVGELTALDVRPGEIEELDRVHKLAANASKLTQGVGTALQALYEGNDDDAAAAHDLVSQACSQLTDLSELDARLSEPARLLGEAQIQISEAVDSLRHYLGEDASEQYDLAQIETRLAAIHDLARKHNVKAADIPELTAKLADDLNQIENVDENLESLRTQTDAARKTLQDLADRLSNARELSAASLQEDVTANMQLLSMPDGKFIVQLERLDSPGPAGQERVSFNVAINPGMRPGPLAKVASGGELSRVSLAIQVVASSRVQTPTLIFDEVDSGVGGGTADIVGGLLRDLASTAQVLSVTHLPQVASKGHSHFRVSKLSDGEITRTSVSALGRDERIEEIARMLGGVKITQRTRAHAKEMLDAVDQKVTKKKAASGKK